MAKAEVCKTFIRRFDSGRRLHVFGPPFLQPELTLDLARIGADGAPRHLHRSNGHRTVPNAVLDGHRGCGACEVRQW